MRSFFSDIAYISSDCDQDQRRVKPNQSNTQMIWKNLQKMKVLPFFKFLFGSKSLANIQFFAGKKLTVMTLCFFYFYNWKMVFGNVVQFLKTKQIKITNISNIDQKINTVFLSVFEMCLK